MPIFRRRETRAVLGGERRDPSAATIGARSSSVGLAAAPEMSDDWALRQAYLANVFVHAAVNAVADDLASLAFRVGPDPETPQDYDVEHPLARLLGPPPGGPNPSTTARRLWRFTIAQLLLTGRFGWEKERASRGGDVVALWPLVSGRISPVATDGGTTWFAGLDYDAGAGKPRRLAIEDVVYEWRPAPDDFRKPESVLAAARLDVSVAVMQDRYDLAFLRNDARPSAVIVHEAFADVRERDAWRTDFLSSHQGPDNAGRVSFVEADPSGATPKEALLIQTLGLSQSDAKFIERYEAKIRGILVALGVPLSRLMDASGRTFANADAEIAAYWQNTIRPLALEVADAVNVQLAPDFGPSTVGWFDFTKIRWLRDEPALVVPTLREAVQLGLVGGEEARELMGLDPELLPEDYAVETPDVDVEDAPSSSGESEEGPDDSPDDSMEESEASPVEPTSADGGERAAAAEVRATYSPPEPVRNAASRALRWIAEGKAGDGFTDVGRRRASQLANGQPVSLDTIRRMASYFARHAPDRQAPGFFDGPAFPSPGRVAWDAWGGDPGRDWSRRILDAEDDDGDRSEPTPEVRVRAVDRETFDATMDAFEALFERRIERLLARQKRAVLDRLRGNRGRSAHNRGELRSDAVFDAGFWARETAELGLDLFTQITTQAGTDVSARFGIRFDLDKPEVQAFIRERTNRLSGNVTTTTYRSIQEQLVEGVVAGEGIPELAKRIEGLFDVTWKGRPKLVARTEVIGSYNGASLRVAQSYGPDVVAGAEWIATLDARVRPEHRAADGQVRRTGEPFSVGGKLLEYPQEPNCRCTLGFLTPEDMARATRSVPWDAVERIATDVARGRRTVDEAVVELRGLA